MALSSEDAFANEIVEIFVEEVADVLSQIDKNLPLWQNNGDDKALKEVRRAFHTLKGSGRMVQADSIGDVAWAVENMLNRVLDNTVKANKAMYELVHDVRHVIPELVNAFENNLAIAVTGINVVQYIDRAAAILQGREVDVFHRPDVAPPKLEPGQKPKAVEPALSNVIDTQAMAASVMTDDQEISLLAATASAAEVELVQEQLASLKADVDDLKRNLLSMSTQLDTLTTQVKLTPKSIDSDVFKRQLDSAYQEIQELKYFVKSASEQMQQEIHEGQKRATLRVEKELRDTTDLAAQLNADFKAISVDIHRSLKAQIISWSLGSAIVCFLAVMAVMMLV